MLFVQWSSTALSRACFHGLTEIAVYLIEHGAKIDIRDESPSSGQPKSGDSPLIMACMGNHKEVVQCLVAFGADMEFVGKV
jgi:ankyrin repeat protein